MTKTTRPSLATFEQGLAAAWPPSHWCDVSVVVALSGGPDSVALLRGLVALKSTGAGQLTAAHFNHCLRGADSDADQSFARNLCSELGVACDVGRADIPVAPSGDGIEAAARAQRYAFLQSVAERRGARFVVTAHTADDQAETILHRIVRGTGLAGLSGMRRARPLGPVTLLRPMLEISRAQVESYLTELGQTSRLDGSNSDMAYMRNRIRHELLPLLADGYNPAVGDALRRLGQLAGDVQDALRPQIEALLESNVDFKNPALVVVDCRGFCELPKHVVRELFVAIWQRQAWPLQAMGFDTWQDLAELAQADELTSPARVLSGAIAAQKKGGELLLTRL